MADAVGPEGQVYAYEPVPPVFRELTTRLARAAGPTGGSNVAARNLALGEIEGQTQFSYVPGDPAYSGFKGRVLPDGLHAETISVAVQRLDRLLMEVDRVRFVKIDAEGGELTVLRGATKLISARAPIVSFELGNNALVNYEYSAADYFDFFFDLGYTVYSIFGIPLERDELIAAAEEQLFWDYIAIPGQGRWPFGHEQLRVLIRQLRVLPADLQQADTTIRQARAEAAEAQVAALLGSTSWRVTAPLRRLSALFLK
jgi:FkbM family methyltransferase